MCFIKKKNFGPVHIEAKPITKIGERETPWAGPCLGIPWLDWIPTMTTHVGCEAMGHGPVWTQAREPNLDHMKCDFIFNFYKNKIKFKESVVYSANIGGLSFYIFKKKTLWTL